MSEIGTISQEYQTSAELFSLINESVITFKKLHFNLPGAAQVSEQDAACARSFLVEFLKLLVTRLESPGGAAENAANPKIEVPPFFIKRLLEKHSGSLEWYVEDLDELRSALEGQGTLSDEKIGYLDELCGQLDAETTALHRRMWRK